MTKQIIHTENAPAAVGPYSQGIVANGFFFGAGQGPLKPGTKEKIEGGIQEQTRRTLENVKAVLEAAGTSLDNVVKATVFLDDIGDFAAMNAVYAEYFTQDPPARSTYEVANLPMGILVEIEVVALMP